MCQPRQHEMIAHDTNHTVDHCIGEVGWVAAGEIARYRAMRGRMGYKVELQSER